MPENEEPQADEVEDETSQPDPEPNADEQPDDDGEPSPDSSESEEDPTLSEIKDILADLEITPGQLKGRLEASKKNEKRAKTNAETVEQSKETISKLTSENLALTVAIEKQVDPDYLEFLTGDTREELEAKAAKLGKRKNPAPNTDGQGKVGNPISGKKDVTPNDLLRIAAQK